MRTDRILTLAIGRPIARARAWASRPEPAVGRALRIPILMYHGVSTDATVDTGRSPYFRTVTTPATFARQMDTLDERGHQVVTLSSALRSLRGLGREKRSAGRPVVLTFDDGLASFADEAWPVLESHGFNATVFLSTAYLDGHFPTGEACLRTEQVRRLAARGVEFGSHTVTHRRMQGLDDDQLRRELVESRATVERACGTQAALFSHPYRFPEENRPAVARLRAALRDAGYEGGVTTSIGRAAPSDDPLFLRRLPVNDLDDGPLFEAKLEGAYDWLHAAQLFYKQCRRSLTPAGRPT